MIDPVAVPRPAPSVDNRGERRAANTITGLDDHGVRTRTAWHWLTTLSIFVSAFLAIAPQSSTHRRPRQSHENKLPVTEQTISRRSMPPSGDVPQASR